MTLDNAARDGNGRSYQSASRNSNGQGTRLAKLTTRQLGRGPGTPGSWSRFLMAHAHWILGVTLAVAAAAAVFAFSQTRLYQSEAEVVVEPPPVAAGSAAQEPDMSTEAGVVTSGVVLDIASRATGAPASTLANGLSVKAQGASYVLEIMYSNPNRYIAQQRAEAIARAYTSYRSAKPTPKSGLQSSAPVATLITSASLPASSYSPSYGLDIGAALLVGLTLAIVTAWARDYLDDRLRGPLDLERQADADLLALIPAFRPAGPEPCHRLVMALAPRSMAAEAYLGLRTRTLLAAAARNSRTVLVTSPAWEDRGMVAANLAAALAQGGHRTVLVCADLRWGTAHLVLGAPDDGGGLARLLERRTDLASALQPTMAPGLHVLPPGAFPPDPGALLQRPGLATVLTEIRSQADVVVIEAPPLLASPDTRPLADTAEMILLIADAQVSTRAQVRAAVRELQQERARFAGCVLINVGTPQRLTEGLLTTTYDHPAHSRPRRATASDGSEPPRPDAALTGQGADITEEYPWQNGS